MKIFNKLLRIIIIIIVITFDVFLLKSQPPSTALTPMLTTDGAVQCVVTKGDTIYIGGSFNIVWNPDNTMVFRNYIAAINSKTGYVLPWNPNSDGAVSSMSLSGNILYVGGFFQNIGSKARNYIAALKTDTDYFIANDWNPDAIYPVTKVIASGTNVYCAGSFPYIGGKLRNGVACITTLYNNNNATDWNPAPNGTGVTDILLVGNTLYVSGDFTSIGGKTRKYLAAVLTTVNDNNATDWDPNPNAIVNSITYLGTTLYAAGNFTSIGGQNRTRIAAINMLTNVNNATGWNPNVNGNIFSINAFDGRIYIGGTFSLINGITRNFIGSINSSPNTNNTSNWNPILDSYVDKINIRDSAIFVGGNFLTVNSLSRKHFAIFKPLLPSLTTKNVTNITTNSAVSGGIITTDGGPPVTARGVCWGIFPNPTIDDAHTTDSSGIGSFNSSMTGLSIYTSYHVRAYATNSLGTAYGNDIAFYTLPAIYSGQLPSVQFCVGDSISVPFEATPGFEDSNYFIAQLSDNQGNFDNPIKLDSIKSKESGEIQTRIPLNTTFGIGYRFRVVATQPSATLRDNGVDIQINELPEVTLESLPSVCIDHTQIDLAGGNPAGGVFSGNGVLNNQFHPSIAGPGKHTITYTYTNGFGCSSKASSTITVNSLPVVTMSIITDICIDGGTISLTGGTPAGGTYSGNGITGTIFNPKTAGPGKHTITYTYTDSNGCTNTDSADINVNSLPVVSLSLLDDVCLNSPAFQLTGGNPAGGNYTGTGVTNNMFNPVDAGVGIHTIQYTYTDNNGCTDSATNTIKVKPVPPKPIIIQTDYRTLSSSADYGNQWYLDGILMPGDTSKILHPKASAKYTVEVSGDNGCKSDLSDEYVFHNLAVDELDFMNNISIYPNPADKELFIRVNTDKFSRINISINNLLGEKVISREISGIEQNKVEIINTSAIPVGIYIMNLISGNNSITRKIIIQR